MKCIFKMWILDLEILDVIISILVLQGVTDIAHWCDEVSFLTVSLKGNPLCWVSNLARFCESETEDKNYSQNSTSTTSVCPTQACPPPYEYSTTSPVACFCALCLLDIGWKVLDSQIFVRIDRNLRCSWHLVLSCLFISCTLIHLHGKKVLNWECIWSFFLYMMLKTTHVFNRSEIQRIFDMFTSWKIRNPDMFGSNELISFSLLGFHKDGLSQKPLSDIFLQ